MKVQVHAADEGGCGFYRMIWPTAAVAAAGHDVELICDGAIHMNVGEKRGVKYVDNVPPVNADVIVIQRPLSRLLTDAIPMIQENGTAVIVELDDDFQNIHPQNKAWKEVQPKLAPDTNWTHLRRAIKMADGFTCTSQALADKYGVPGKTTIIPNYLPDAYRHININAGFPRKDWRLGWSGSLATHPTDLQAAEPLVRAALSEKHGGELHILGTGIGVAEALRLETEQVHADRWVPLHEYPQAMAYPHIGMVPLARHPFNEAKSWLKGLEYAGAGVPFIASPAAEYWRLFREYGIGRVAKKPSDWAKHLRALTARDGVWEHEQGQQREWVLESMMIDQHADRWWAAWSAARARRSAQHRGGYPDDVMAPTGSRFAGSNIAAEVEAHIETKKHSTHDAIVANDDL